jgi:GT2 family glycosyltransferase
MFTSLSIIIVNWNLKNDTIECIESLLKAGASLGQIIIVDNGSTDGSIGALRNYFQNSIFIIDAKKNLGYAEGANIGIQYALSQNYEWLLLLNNDTIVDVDFMEEMQNATLNSSDYSILTPVILYHNKPSIIWFLGGHQIGNTLLTINYYKNRKIDRNLPQLIPIEFTNGCAMMINRIVFEKVGLLDSSLFMYGEEVDLCWRAKLAGYKFACFTPARLWHKISKSSQSDLPQARFLQIRNQIYFYRRYSHSLQKSFYFMFTLLRTLVMCIFYLLNKQIKLIPATFNGWANGWFSKSNKQNG